MLEHKKSYYSTREAAKLLDVAVSTIQLWSNNGILKAWKTGGGHRRISSNSVDDMLAEQLAVAMPEESQKPLKIVIVEDDEQQVRLYKKQFSYLTFSNSVVYADDGYKGLMKIGAILPDVIISDLMMPNINGFKMIDSLKTVPELNKVLIIVVTGLTKDEINDKGGLPKEVQVFTKPLAFEKMEALLVERAEFINTESSINI